MRRALVAVLLITTTTAAEAGAASSSHGPTVGCTIRAPDDSGSSRVVFDGPCRFVPDGKAGSFSISAVDGTSALYDDMVTVSVSVVAPGKAEVRGLTTAGINSRWGEARRSKVDPACWTGSDFEVCARRKP